MYFDLRFLLMAGVNALMLYAYQLLNDALAPWSVYLCLIGPLIVVPVFYLGFRGAILCALITGLLLTAAYPISLQWTLPVVLILNLLVFLNRHRYQRESVWQIVVLSLVINTLWLFWLVVSQAHAGMAWGRMLLDLALSEIAVVGVALWVHTLQRTVLSVFRMSMDANDYAGRVHEL